MKKKTLHNNYKKYILHFLYKMSGLELNNSWLPNYSFLGNYISNLAAENSINKTGFQPINYSDVNMSEIAKNQISSNTISDVAYSTNKNVLAESSDSNSDDDENKENYIKDSTKRSKYRMQKKNTVFKKVCLVLFI